jgi:acyl carrier protein
MLDSTVVRGKIRSFIVEVFFVDDFSDEESLLRNGIVDSMGMAQLVAFLEQEFGLKVDDGELVPENLDSVARAAAFVARKRGLSAA